MNTYNHAIYLLSRREHSRHELTDKLIRKGHEPEDVVAVLDRLQAENLQSDQRFLEGLVRVRLGQGKGPRWIINELSEHQLSPTAIKAEVYAQAHDWGAVAISVRAHKFGLAPPENYAHKAKQQRFLQYRGFENEHIRLALEAQNEIS